MHPHASGAAPNQCASLHKINSHQTTWRPLSTAHRVKALLAERVAILGPAKCCPALAAPGAQPHDAVGTAKAEARLNQQGCAACAACTQRMRFAPGKRMLCCQLCPI